jgi:hypothetical protein
MHDTWDETVGITSITEATGGWQSVHYNDDGSLFLSPVVLWVAEQTIERATCNHPVYAVGERIKGTEGVRVVGYSASVNTPLAADHDDCNFLGYGRADDEEMLKGFREQAADRIASAKERSAKRALRATEGVTE